MPIKGRLFFFITFSLFVFVTGVRVATPFVFSYLASTITLATIFNIAVFGYALLFLFIRILEEARFVTYIAFEQSLQKTLSLYILECFYRLPFNELQKRAPSETLIIIDRGLVGLRSVLYNFVFTIAPLLIEAVVLIICIGVTINWFLALFTFIIFNLFIIITSMISSQIRNLQEIWFATASRNYKILSESLRSYETIRSFQQEHWVRQRYIAATDSFIQEVVASLKPGIILGIVQGFLLFVLIGGVNWYISALEFVETGRVSLLILVNGLLLQIITPLLEFAGSYRIFIQGLSSTKQLNQIISFSPALGKHNHRFKGGNDGIILHDVKVLKKDFYSNVSFPKKLKFGKGAITVIYGPSGAGKTTLARIIAGLADVDGDISTSIPANLIFLTRQEVDIFDLSLNENIHLGLPLDNEKMAYVLGSAGFSEAELIDLRDRSLGENGAAVSGGQKRRIGIARMLYFEAAALVLDEPTAGLDPLAKRIVLDSLKALVPEKTLIIVSHDPDVIAIANHTIEISNENNG